MSAQVGIEAGVSLKRGDNEVQRDACQPKLRLAEEETNHVPPPAEDPSVGIPNRKLLAEAWTNARLQRDRAFSDDLFSDPAWDILLDLYLAHCNRQRVSVTSACVAANAPATTALRWIALLERKGLITRANDPRDSRRKLLNLTDEAMTKIEAALDGAARSDRRLGLGRLRLVE